jgi:hypothetical protein
MKVFTLYDGSSDAPPNQASLIKLWFLSWQRMGWEPRLLTKKTIGGKPRAFSYSPRLKGIFVPSNVINFGLRRRPKKWDYVMDSAIVVFHDYDPKQVLNHPRWR